MSGAGEGEEDRGSVRADTVKHFPALDHPALRAELAKVITDGDARWLIDQVVASGASVLDRENTPVHFPGDDLFASLRPRGMPIGNLTSQFWSNVSLNSLDWFVTRQLRSRAYLR